MPARTAGWPRAALLALRLSALAVFLFALLRPVLVVRTVEPQRNVLAVLVDGSRSMDVADFDSRPRSAFVREALGPSGALRASLSRRFSLRDFEFASTARRVADPEAIPFGHAFVHWAFAAAHRGGTGGAAGVGARLGQRRRRHVRERMADATLRSLQASNLPVFAVGLGRESFDRDVQMGRVEPPAAVLKGSTLVVEVR